MPRIRTIRTALDEIKRTDPETALTETAVRRLVLSKKLPSTRAGNKYLIDLDALEQHLRGQVIEHGRTV